jgi:signal peptide peptidase SppA
VRPDYANVARLTFDTPWFIREAEGRVIAEIVRRRIAGDRLGDVEIEARIEAARAEQGPRSGQRQAGPVAVVPVYGVIMPRANLFTAMSGGTSVQQIRDQLQAALDDPDYVAVVGEFDSPGGSVEGIEELATWIRAARGQKPMVAVVNTMCCSGAYYLASQMDEIVGSPSSITGDIGVFIEHTEFSRADDEAGVTTTIVRQPAGKHDPNDVEPLSDAGRAYLEEIVGDYYGQFVAAVSKGRGVPAADIRKGYGQGRSMTAARAKAAGLVDRIDTLEGTVARLSLTKPRARASARAGAPDRFADAPFANAAGEFLAAGEADGLSHPEMIAALASGLPYSERLALASGLAAEIAEATRSRVALRAEEGRGLSSATRQGLESLSTSLGAIAESAIADEVDPDPAAEPDPSTSPAATGRRAPVLELLEAAARGGYSLVTSGEA